MNPPEIVESASLKQHQQPQGSNSSRGATWTSCKDEIYRVYMVDKNTLPKTIELFEREFGLKACARTWKSKLKEWNFDKYTTNKEKKVGKRRREGKEMGMFPRDTHFSFSALATSRRKGESRAEEAPTITCELYPRFTNNEVCHEQLRVGSIIDLTAHTSSSEHSEERNASPGDLYETISNESSTLEEKGPQSSPDPHHSFTSSTTLDGAQCKWYRPSLLMFSAVKNDSRLFLAAHSAGLVQISVKRLEYELQRADQKGKSIDEYLWWSYGCRGINVWCDSCLKIFGAQAVYDCATCQHIAEGNQQWQASHCSKCYSGKKTFCQVQDHILKEDREYCGIPRCRIAANPDMERWCDAVNCGKKISGLYFHCCKCKDDDFNICLQCAMGGRACRDVTHAIVCAVRPIDRR